MVFIGIGINIGIGRIVYTMVRIVNRFGRPRYYIIIESVLLRTYYKQGNANSKTSRRECNIYIIMCSLYIYILYYKL